jgi:hypothetical protein
MPANGLMPNVKRRAFDEVSDGPVEDSSGFACRLNGPGSRESRHPIGRSDAGGLGRALPAVERLVDSSGTWFGFGNSFQALDQLSRLCLASSNTVAVGGDGAAVHLPVLGDLP